MIMKGQTMSNGLKYKEVALHEEFGIKSLGVKIMLAAKYDLTDEDKYELDKKCEKIIEYISFEMDRKNPKVQNEVEQERKDIIALFPEPIYVKPIKNGYGENMLFPWFKVTTKRGVIKIGWRRSVINIDWSKSDIKVKAKDLFPNENVTREDFYIHAWSYEKAKEYIDKILEAKNEVA